MQQQFSLEALIFVIILGIYVFTSHLIEFKRVPYLHESTIVIFMGILTSIFAKYGLKKQIVFSNELFFAIILPPIIFSAGYSLRKTYFFENFGLVSFYGIIGTLIGFICMSLFLVFINDYIFKALTPSQVLMLSSILCATDTVAAVALIKPKRYPVLNAVIFGQGIMNDAVAIILFRTIYELKLGQNNLFTYWTVFQMIFNFTYLFVFSVALGTASGFGLSYLFKKLETIINSPLKQTSLILLNGYFTYLMGELLGLSGIITLFTCAIVMGHYTFMNISEESQRGTGLAFETVGYIAQAFVFAYLGASILSIEGKFTAVIMAFIILAAIPFIRIAMVYFLPLIYFILKKQFPLNQKQLKISWYSGMIRGAISFALCLQIQSQDKKYITTIGLVIVMVTAMLGSTMFKKFMKYVGLPQYQDHSQQEQLFHSFNKDKEKYRNTKIRQNNPNQFASLGAMAPPIENTPRSARSTRNNEQTEIDSATLFANRFGEFEQKFIKPIFSRSNKKITYSLDQNEDQEKNKGKKEIEKEQNGGIQEI